MAWLSFLGRYFRHWDGMRKPSRISSSQRRACCRCKNMSNTKQWDNKPKKCCPVVINLKKFAHSFLFSCRDRKNLLLWISAKVFVSLRSFILFFCNLVDTLFLRFFEDKIKRKSLMWRHTQLFMELAVWAWKSLRAVEALTFVHSIRENNFHLRSI